MPRPSTRSRSAPLYALVRQTRGATAVEYGLIVAMIALTAIGGMSAVGQPVTGLFGSIDAYLQNTR
ncbi:Flp family type IVb pilin [Sphingomonas phyllosphaerae]|uniref:Flp family type IVb pilin n=1 Tax=Sphingomonas phyllosphaerae TaxID=257003 RepID=UPI00048F123F|nr:Flp family type IVb pilin [Sphingomonas phyllosphaerae]